MSDQLGGRQHTGLVTPHIAATTLEYFGFGVIGGHAYEPSEWRLRLYRLIDKSDLVNRDLLCRAYPGEIAAFALAQQVPGGIDTLRKIAKGESS